MRIVLFIILLIASYSLHAQCTMVRGVVKDHQTGEVLPGASVRLVGSHTDGVHVDSQGAFELAIMQRDSLVISFIGYDRLTLAIPANCFVTAFLTPSTINLAEVEIQAERLIAEEFTIRKMKKLEIYTNPSAKADPLLAVNSLPSATTLDESANISLRGSNPAETGIFLNNVPINDAVRYAQLNGIGTFSIFNTALINQVQVYPGNPPLDFGNTTSGLIALYTDEVIPEKNTYSASLSLASIGLYMQRKLNQSSSLTAFTNYQPSAAIRWVNHKSLERLKGFNTVDLGLHYFSNLGKNTIIKIFNYSNIESFRYHTEQPTYSGIFDQHKKRNYTVSNVRHRFANSELSWNSGANFSSSGFKLSTLNVSLDQRDFYTALNYQLQYEKFELKTGASYDYRSNRTQGTYPVYDFAVGEAYPSKAFQSSAQLHIPEVFVYGKYYLTPNWIVGTGIRKNIRTAQQPDFLSWQINLNAKPAENWSIIASTGAYNKFQLPQNGENTVTHIQTKQYGVDISYTPSNLESSISIFYKTGKQNNLHLETKGIELYGRYRFSRNIRSQLSVTSLQATQTENNVTSSSPYNIHYFIRANTEYKIAGTWTISLVLMIRQGSFYNPVTEATLHPVGVYEPTYGEAKRLPDYHLLDISFSKLMIWSEYVTAVAFCGISNVPNFNNVRDYTYNFDYSQKKEDLFSLRTLYMGCMINF